QSEDARAGRGEGWPELSGAREAHSRRDPRRGTVTDSEHRACAALRGARPFLSGAAAIPELQYRTDTLKRREYGNFEKGFLFGFGRDGHLVAAACGRQSRQVSAV